jgi:hypothetical protein
MQTVQLPFFLNSGKGKNRSATGHAFDVELSPPVVVPKNARNTRLFVQEASTVYSFPNVTAATNRVYLYYRHSLFTLQVDPGLYGTIDELQAGIAAAAIAADVNKSGNALDAVATEADFASQYFRITGDYVTSRVELEVMDQDVQIALDPFGLGNDLFVNVLGYSTTQAPMHAAGKEYYALVSRDGLTADTAPPGYATLVLEWRVSGQSDFPTAFATDGNGNPQYIKFFVPASNHRFSTQALKDTINESIAGEHALLALQHTNAAWAVSLPVVEQLFINNLNGGDSPEVYMQMSSGASVIAWRFASTYGTGAQTIHAPLQTAGAALLPTGTDGVALMGNPLTGTTSTAWVENLNAGRALVRGANPATIDRVHSLQIAAPGLAAGVHVNGESGSSTLCRFPVNTAPGGVITYEPINPIRNAYDLSGTRLSRFRVELQSQTAEAVDCRGESYNLTIVLEYEVPSGVTAEH